MKLSDVVINIVVIHKVNLIVRTTDMNSVKIYILRYVAVQIFCTMNNKVDFIYKKSTYEKMQKKKNPTTLHVNSIVQYHQNSWSTFLDDIDI
jgi:hypothetical protein